MNFLQLKYFIKATEHGSMSQAADALGISQAALSLSIGKLEDELQYPLIDHHKRGVNLTPFGEIFLKYCILITNERDDIHLEFQELNGVIQEKSVHIGISDKQYYADWLVDIFDEYPDMRLYTEIIPEQEIQRQLINGTLDFGILSGPGIKPSLNRRLLTSQPYELIVLADHPLANRTMINAELLAEQPLLSLSPSAKNDRIVDILSRELNFTPNIIFEGAPSVMIDLFHAGFGGIVTCAHDKQQYMRLPPENYCSLEILGTASRYEFYLQWAEHRYFTQYNQLFRNYVLNYYHIL